MNLKPYNENRKVRIAHELFENYRLGNLSIFGQKLLYALAQCLDHTETLFPVFEVDIRGLFKYLNLSDDNNARYSIVRDAIENIVKNPLEQKISHKKWRFINWLATAEFNAENSMFVTLQFTNECKPFLLNFKQYCELTTKFYIGLSSNFAMWIYPHLKNSYKKKGGIHEMSIERLKEITYTDKLPSYDLKRSSSATKDFLKKVIGIENKKGIVEGSNKKVNCWVIATEKNKGTGKRIECGPLAEINAKTDLYVEAEAIKKNSRSFNYVRFHIRLKTDVKATVQRQKQLLVQFGPDSELGKKKKRCTYISYETMRGVAEAQGISIQEACKRTGYKITDNGKQFYKAIN